METAVPTYVTTDRKMAPGANTSPGLRSWSIVTMVICKKQREIVWYLFYEKRRSISRVLQPTTHNVLWV